MQQQSNEYIKQNNPPDSESFLPTDQGAQSLSKGFAKKLITMWSKKYNLSDVAQKTLDRVLRDCMYDQETLKQWRSSLEIWEAHQSANAN